MTDELDLFDVVTVGAAGSGQGVRTVDASAESLEALARRAGVEVAAIWRATWALVLARLGGVARARVESSLVDVPREGEVVAWLRTSSIAANGTAKPTIGDGNGALVWRAEHGRASATFDQARIDHATVERLGELLRIAITAVTASERLEQVSPLSAAERELVVTAVIAMRSSSPSRSTVA
jgi:hypothetical protein